MLRRVYDLYELWLDFELIILFFLDVEVFSDFFRYLYFVIYLLVNIVFVYIYDFKFCVINIFLV